MAFLEARLAGRLVPRVITAASSRGRLRPECVVLGVAPGVEPNRKPPVRIFVGTEPAQYRAERVFLWSIRQVRDPARVYEVHLMKDLAGFDRRRWLTGFTNYRFAIPHFAGCTGRAIYNDVDQIYLADPGELFDTDMGGHGYLSVNDRDTSVMLIDCAATNRLWTLEIAQQRRRKDIESLAREAGLWGSLEAGWNSRDGEYAEDSSMVLHYTTIHAQPWQPFPRRYVYLQNPVGGIWHDLERSANATGYQVFGRQNPSDSFRSALGKLRTTVDPDTALRDVEDTVQEARTISILPGASSVLPSPCNILPSASSVLQIVATNEVPTAATFAGAQVTRRELSEILDDHSLDERDTFDATVCAGLLDQLPDEDVPWIIAELFARSRRLVCIAAQASGKNCGRDKAWWLTHLAAASARYPACHWRLALRDDSGHATHVHTGGRWLGATPVVWVLDDDKAGHRSQSVGLAQAIGWPYEVKQLSFNALNRLSNRLLGASRLGLQAASKSELAPPWPDLVIGAGRRTAPIARWIGRESRGRTRLVQLGRKGGNLPDGFDLVVTCSHFGLPPHPRRVETAAPLHTVTRETLARAGDASPGLFGDSPRPHVALVVGGSALGYRLDDQVAERIGTEVANWAQATGGSLFAITSPRTGAAASAALQAALEGKAHVHIWQRGQQDNPYLAYLARADAIVVTGESESMLAEATATGKPVYIYPLPERRQRLDQRLKQWVVDRAYTPRWKNAKGTVRPQEGVQYLCARLIERGYVHPPRDLSTLHRALVASGAAHLFGAPLQIDERPPLDEIATVAERVRTMLGVAPIE